MSAGNQSARCAATETLEKFMHIFEIGSAQGSEARERRTLAAVEGWRDSPDPAFTFEKFTLLFLCVFD